MKKIINIFLIFILSIVVVNCDNNLSKNESETLKSKNNSVSIIPNYIYLSINNIENGEVWKDTLEDEYYYYRVLFCSIEEREYIYAELIEVQIDGPVKFIKRIELTPKLIGLDYFNYTPNFKNWDSETVFVFNIKNDIYRVDLNKIFGFEN